MEEKILSKVDELKDEIINGILEVVKIPSIKSQKEEDAPFGVGIRDSLLKALEISERLGFRTKNLENYIGYAEYGEGEKYICSIGHLDVVDVGEGWKEHPFSGYLENGVIYSRGILDNKGPIMSCLYAMYVLKELEVELELPIRIIFGCDEESGEFEDLKYYLKNENPPIMGFTPDCKYPVVYSERGRAILTIFTDNKYTDEFFEFLNLYFLNSKNLGERLGIDFEDEEYGKLEFRNYKLQSDEGKIKFEVVISYPFGTDCEKIIEKVNEKIEKFSGLNAKILNKFLPVKFPKENYMIKFLQKAYEYVTGLDGTPVTTSGGTYAKMMPNIVPFGPSFPGQKNISHNPNEYMSIQDILTNVKIYAISFYKLAGKKL